MKVALNLDSVGLGFEIPGPSARVFYSDFIGLRSPAWKQQKLTLHHTGKGGLVGRIEKAHRLQRGADELQKGREPEQPRARGQEPAGEERGPPHPVPASFGSASEAGEGGPVAWHGPGRGGLTEPTEKGGSPEPHQPLLLRGDKQEQ